MIWNDERIKSWASNGGVTPFDAACVNPASLDLRIGNQFIDMHTGKPFTAETIDLLPGAAILATTIEVVNIPVDVAASIYLKSSMARQGLDHALAGWIDCGFMGSITLELHAHRPVVLNAGQRVVQMVMMQMISPPLKAYQGRYQGQRGPTMARAEKPIELIMDWDKGSAHFYKVCKQYESLSGRPGVNVSFALVYTLEPLAKRFNSGERTPELYDEMMAVE